MASATVRKGHIYDPSSEETITDSDGFVEIIITDRTSWAPLCKTEEPISNNEYESLFDGTIILEDCQECKNIAIEEDPDGIIFDF